MSKLELIARNVIPLGVGMCCGFVVLSGDIRFLAGAIFLFYVDFLLHN